mmetsp:Transcript_29863/g.63417  ORF Transcript_29863/g.63417 Transcript_29863/m.63417 type:complete len:108 (-) Transcript_29863:330-653(-)
MAQRTARLLATLPTAPTSSDVAIILHRPPHRSGARKTPSKSTRPDRLRPERHATQEGCLRSTETDATKNVHSSDRHGGATRPCPRQRVDKPPRRKRERIFGPPRGKN